MPPFIRIPGVRPFGRDGFLALFLAFLLIFLISVPSTCRTCQRLGNLLFTQRLDSIQFSFITSQFTHIAVGTDPIEQFVQRGSSQLPLDDHLSRGAYEAGTAVRTHSTAPSPRPRGRRRPERCIKSGCSLPGTPRDGGSERFAPRTSLWAIRPLVHVRYCRRSSSVRERVTRESGSLTSSIGRRVPFTGYPQRTRLDHVFVVQPQGYHGRPTNWCQTNDVSASIGMLNPKATRSTLV